MRAFGGLLVVLGLALIVGYPVLVTQNYQANVAQWLAEGERLPSVESLRQRIAEGKSTGEDVGRVLRHADRTPQPESWTPGVAFGGGLFALGVIVLAVRRPERKEGR